MWKVGSTICILEGIWITYLGIIAFGTNSALPDIVRICVFSFLYVQDWEGRMKSVLLTYNPSLSIEGWEDKETDPWFHCSLCGCSDLESTVWNFLVCTYQSKDEQARKLILDFITTRAVVVRSFDVPGETNHFLLGNNIVVRLLLFVFFSGLSRKIFHNEIANESVYIFFISHTIIYRQCWAV